jgi:hypothetical protein
MPHLFAPIEFPSQTHKLVNHISSSHQRLNPRRLHQSDPNSIEYYSEYENQQSIELQDQIRWNRNNIAVTMERYVPAIKHQTPKVHLNHHSSKTMPKKSKPADVYFDEVYPYGYYQPGQSPAPSHQYTSSGDSRETDSSASPPPSSIRALFSTVTRNIMRRASSKFSCDMKSETSTSRINENLYDEILDGRERLNLRPELSLPTIPTLSLAEEIQHVHNNHHRVLGELNLAVEEMLMPPSFDIVVMDETPT